jgi:hypothetical protein
MRAPALLAVAIAFAAGTAAAGELGRPGGRAGDLGRPPLGGGPAGQAEALEGFRQQRALEAEAELRGQARDAERRAEERRLSREGTGAQLEAYRQRVRAEEASDSLRLRSRAARVSATGPVPADWWSGLGPETRRVLLESGIEQRRQERLREVEVRTRPVERDIERRERPPARLSP